MRSARPIGHRRRPRAGPAGLFFPALLGLTVFAALVEGAFAAVLQEPALAAAGGSTGMFAVGVAIAIHRVRSGHPGQARLALAVSLVIFGGIGAGLIPRRRNLGRTAADRLGRPRASSRPARATAHRHRLGRRCGGGDPRPGRAADLPARDHWPCGNRVPGCDVHRHRRTDPRGSRRLRHGCPRVDRRPSRGKSNDRSSRARPNSRSSARSDRFVRRQPPRRRPRASRPLLWTCLLST